MTRVRVLPESARSPGRRETESALSLANRMPHLVLEARRVAANLSHGIHGRRRAGAGETFWQFRPFVTGEAAHRIDWRRSARDDRLYVREREWETAQTVWFWIDRSGSMGYVSDLAQAPKIERAIVLGLALADSFVEAGERVGMLGLMSPRATRRIAETMAQTLVTDRSALEEDLPPQAPVAPQHEAVLISDFLSPTREITAMVEGISSRGARGHLVMIVDPVEETFPFQGQAVLHDLEDGLSLRIGDAISWGRAYRLRIEQHREELQELARRRGWTLTIHRTDRPASEAALRVMTLVSTSRGTGPGGR
ncbi:DUF58 domain-containing protein [Microvirga sp. 3-52]|jgi:uncharacterized protein (DUF58 family)|uniref:DUF58 domain-containing protein n=1 Tax=Microvirga sp. 3-52 TaxID=2792425 RepID=UPI001AD3FCBE|nr:DUF58 domain-containing protein [Microvirga sp. 3-52]MBO1906283.1 DUF58 domain-containing protein [Microvirga sp. 3-52]MBS7453540.1 DUF58 domain-containing protein [Microvirga sp. 3-52]